MMLSISAMVVCPGNVKGQYQVGERVWSPPRFGNYFNLAFGGTNFPPTPFFPHNPIDVPVYSLNGSNSFIYDDSLMQEWAMLQSDPPPPPGEGGGSDTNYPIAPAYSSYGSNDLWLEITKTISPADFALLTLHGTRSTNVYQLQSKTNIGQSAWRFGQVIFQPNDGATDFDPLFIFANQQNFFRAQKGTDSVRLVAGDDALEPTNGASGHTGTFVLFRDSPTTDHDLTVFYKVSGSATMGADYASIAGSNLVGSVTFQANGSQIETISIQPLQDNLVEFEESVTLTLIRTNDYLVPPELDSATIWISDNFGSNIFTVVARNLDGPAGIGYHPVTDSLIVSVKTFTNADINFIRISSDGTISPWSSAHGNQEEKKLTIVQSTAHGFSQGEVFFGTDVNGVIGWISADGTAWTNNWAALSTDTNSATALLRGSLYIDQVGTFGGDLICVTGGDSVSDGGEVWRVTSSKVATLLTKIESLAPHLEGVIVLTNSPWSGRIVTGTEGDLPPAVYAIETNGVVASFDLKIEPEDFDLVQTNQDLYCIDQGDGDNQIQPRLFKLSKTLLTNFWGDLLITQEGAQHLSPPPPKKEGKLFFLHWENSKTNFVVRRISQQLLFEHSTFAPITLPDL